MLAISTLSACAYLEYMVAGKGPIEMHTAALLKEARQAVGRTIADRGREKKILALYEEMTRIFHAYDDRLVIYFEQLAALNADYDARREDIERVLSAIVDTRVELYEQAVRIRGEMIAVTSPEEWARLTEGDKSIFSLAKQSPDWDRYFID